MKDLNRTTAGTFGRRLRELREGAGLSQERLAFQLKTATGDVDFISRKTIDNYERGSTDPSLRRVMAIADLFGVSLDDLVQRGSPSEEESAADTPLALGMSVNEAASVLGVSEVRILQLVHQGVIPISGKMGRSYVLTQSDREAPRARRLARAALLVGTPGGVDQGPAGGRRYTLADSLLRKLTERAQCARTPGAILVQSAPKCCPMPTWCTRRKPLTSRQDEGVPDPPF